MTDMHWLYSVPPVRDLLLGSHARCFHEGQDLASCTCLTFDAEHVRCRACGGEWSLGPSLVDEEVPA